jgi:hypothetical protein
VAAAGIAAGAARVANQYVSCELASHSAYVTGSTRRVVFAALVIGGKLYVFGGLVGKWTNHDHFCELFDQEADKWCERGL